MIAAITYNKIPVPANTMDKTHKSLIITGSIPKYSPIPPHTPAITLFLLFDNVFIFISPLNFDMSFFIGTVYNEQMIKKSVKTAI